jgi:hypothetical protein
LHHTAFSVSFVFRRQPSDGIYGEYQIASLGVNGGLGTLITIKASSAALPSLAPPCGVLLHTPQSSLLGA